MKILKLKTKTPFIASTGSNHENAVIIVSSIENNIINKELIIRFSIFNSLSDVGKLPIDSGFMLRFKKVSDIPTLYDNNGSVIRLGEPNYDEVLNLFELSNEGIIIKNSDVENWFLTMVSFQGKSLSENWEII
jgi:hypothetical protein